MRAFIILASFAIYANAAHLGYQYEQTIAQVPQRGYQSGGYGTVQSHSSTGGYFGSVGGISHGSSIGGYSGSVSGASHGSSIGGYSGSVSGASHGSSIGAYSGPVSGANQGSSIGGYSGSVGGDAVSHEAVGAHGSAGVTEQDYQKEFYSFSAPEHEFDQVHETTDSTSSFKKNLRVIFIKGPENSGLEKAALQLAKSAADQQTAIYVLSKQADLSELAQKLRNENIQSHSKPEVHFVKYRTPEEAEHAKHAIQAQYESLPGSTNSHDGGVAPVHTFASNQQAPPAAPATASNAYLPPHLRV